VGHCRRECRESGDTDVRARAGGRARGGQDDHRQPDISEHQTDQAAGERRNEAPKSDRDEEEGVQAVEYRLMANRMRRVNESVRQVLSEAIGQLKDPRIGFVTVTGVETSPDLRHARVFVSVLGAVRKREQTLVGLQAAHSVLQAQIARELRMKRTPQLAFEYDPSVERGVRMTKLIDELAPDDSE
jgi:ribosome-binding factor A